MGPSSTMDSWREITKDVFIIAEIGKNFIQTQEERSVQEYLENAKVLVKKAKDAGADAVKFQTHNVEDEQLNLTIVSPHFKGSDRYNWVRRNTNSTPFDGFWKPLKSYCDEIGILFFSTPMSRGAAQRLTELGVPFWKIGSGDILDFVMLDYMASTGKPIVFSSGMSTLEETDKAIAFLKARNAPIALLHCISKYPCPPEELQLATIEFYNERYDIPIGFSDHSVGYDSAIAAVALGAKIIEKHFSLSRELWGSDHKVSMTPQEFKKMVEEIRLIEQDPSKRCEYLQKDIVKRGMGIKGKTLQEGEAVFRQYFRKSLMAGTKILQGTVITKEMVYAMRPQAFAKGLPSEEYDSVIGKKITKNVDKYDPITQDILE